MKTTDSGKLFEHIEEAKGWLDKAKEQMETNPVHGELILNLAQAEVKCAWELTHQQNVSTNIKKIPNKIQKKRNYYIPAAAASIIIISGLIFGLQFGKVSKPETPGIAKSLSGQDNKTDNYVQNTVQSPKPLVNTPVIAESKEKPNLNRKPLAIVKSEPAEVTSNIEATKAEVVIESTPVVSSNVSVRTTENQKEVAVNSKNESETERTEQNPGRVKPVSQISIDVEALTQEASQTLRKGK